MVNLGDRAVGSTVSFLFNTHKADGTPITLAGSPVVSVYKNSTTQSTTGVTLSVDYDSVTGMHQVVVDTSADGTFYATGNDFNVVVTTGTVNSISVVGSVVGKFSIGRQNISHAASVAWGSGAITAGAIATDAIGADEIASGAVTKIQTGLATPTNITAGTITTVTNLTNAATVGSLTTAMKSEVNAEVDTALADIKLDHLVAVAESGDVVNSSIIAKLASKSATPAFTSFDNTTDSLEAIADAALSGTVDANLVSIDGELTNDNNATLFLKRLDIKNDDANGALQIENTGGNSIYVNSLVGNTVYLNAQGVGTNAGNGIKIISADASAVSIESNGTEAALSIYGQGNGVSIAGGATAGHGLKIETYDALSDGINITGKESGVRITSDGNDAALYIKNTTADGIAVIGALHGLSLAGSGAEDLHLVYASSNIGTPIDVTLSAAHGSGGWDSTSSGTMDANLVSIDGQLTIGNNATLNLKRISIANNTSDAAIDVSNSVGNAATLIAAGDGLSVYGAQNGIVAEGVAGLDFKLTTESSNVGEPIDTTLSLVHGLGQWDSTATSTNLTAINGDTTAAANLGKSAKSMVIGKVDTSTLTPTTTVFETNLTDAIYKDRWLVFTSGTNKDSAKPIHACALVGLKVKMTTYAFPNVPANDDEFIIV